MDFMEFALQESKEFKIERTNIRYLGNARFGTFMVLLTFVARFSMMSLYLVNLPWRGKKVLKYQTRRYVFFI